MILDRGGPPHRHLAGARAGRAFRTGMCVLSLATASALAPGWAQEAETVRSTVGEALEMRRETQQRREAWEEERQALEGRYRTARSDLAYLDQRLEVLQERLAALEDRNRELARRIEESARLEASLQDTMTAALERLGQRVRADLPFLPDERARRLEDLSRELTSPTGTGAEKLRRLFEGLHIEAQYGHTLEVYQQRITVDGQPLHTDVLRLGRLALFWLTPDGDRAGWYDPGEGAWQPLPTRYRRAVREAYEMAARMRPAGVVELPIGEVAP